MNQNEFKNVARKGSLYTSIVSIIKQTGILFTLLYVHFYKWKLKKFL